MSDEPVLSISTPFRILWNDRPVAAFESASGLDPWRRTIRELGDELFGDIHDELRSSFLPGSPSRDEGGGHTVTFLRGVVWDPGFRSWITGGEEDEASDSPTDLVIELSGSEDEAPNRYRLGRCSVQRFVGAGRPRGARVRVTRLELACAGWDWDTPEESVPAGSLLLGPGAALAPRRSCWKAVAAGAAIGALIVAGVLVPRLGEDRLDLNLPAAAQGAIGSSPAGPGYTGPDTGVIGLPRKVPPPRQKRVVGPTSSATRSPTIQPSPTETLPLIVPANQPPVASDDWYVFTYTGSTKTVRAPGVLTNDEDPDGDAMTAVLVTSAAYGTVSLNPDGSFEYTPSEASSDTFSYSVFAGGVYSDVAVVHITLFTT